MVGYIYNFDSLRNRFKSLVLIGKGKIRYSNTFPIGKLLSFPQLRFFHTFKQKLFICIHLSLFMHTIQDHTILSSSNITY